MREELIAELTALKKLIEDAGNAAGRAAISLMSAKKALQDKEDALLMGKVEDVVIDGKNAETRAAQMREHTAVEREKVMHAEAVLEGARTTLANRRAELQINLALTELIKEVA